MFASVNDMLSVLDRMAIRAENLKVFYAVIASVSVFVVHAKYVWILAIAASAAFFYQPAPTHSDQCRIRELRIESGELVFAYTRPGAEYSFLGRGPTEFLLAAFTLIPRFPAMARTDVVALSRAIFRRFLSKADDRKTFQANFASNGNLAVFIVPAVAASARTEFECCPSAFPNANMLAALDTCVDSVRHSSDVSHEVTQCL